MEAIRDAGVTIGVDPLGGASLPYWQAIAARYGLQITIVNPAIDPAFGFMTLDHDGKIRMDCSSPYAMAGLVALKDRFQVAVGNDPDADRHGIVTASAGLMNPNHYLAVAIQYLLANRPAWPADGRDRQDRRQQQHDRPRHDGRRATAGGSAGRLQVVRARRSSRAASASAARRAPAPASCAGTARVWTTDKDGLIMALLAAEITARTGKDPGEHYRALEAAVRRAALHAGSTRRPRPSRRHNCRSSRPRPSRRRRSPANRSSARLTRAPENDAPIDGLKVVAASGWFAARPSGTEDIYKIYAESFKSRAHLDEVVAEAQRIVDASLR